MGLYKTEPPEKVDIEKKVIYLVLALELPVLDFVFLKSLIISVSIMTKNSVTNIKSTINSSWKFDGFNSMKLSFINVKKVNMPSAKHAIKIRKTHLFFLIKFIILNFYFL